MECEICGEHEPKIITLFTRQVYCGRYCLAEGQAAYARMILRFVAEEVENGNVVTEA